MIILLFYLMIILLTVFGDDFCSLTDCMFGRFIKICHRYEGLIYDETRSVLKVFLENNFRDAVTNTEQVKRKVVTARARLCTVSLLENFIWFTAYIRFCRQNNSRTVEKLNFIKTNIFWQQNEFFKFHSSDLRFFRNFLFEYRLFNPPPMLRFFLRNIPEIVRHVTDLYPSPLKP
jgi:hypothetical protein